MMQKTALALLVLVGLTACVSQTQPASETGRMCLSDCSSQQEVCITQARQKSQKENQCCIDNRIKKLNACQKKASTEAEKQACEENMLNCEAPKVNRSQCNSDYQQCFVQCGGNLNDEIFTERLRDDYLDMP